MASSRATVNLRVRYAWWLWPYLCILTTLAAVFDCEPDWDKVDRMIAHGTRVEVVPAEDKM
jgi:hypothetical protein